LVSKRTRSAGVLAKRHTVTGPFFVTDGDAAVMPRADFTRFADARLHDGPMTAAAVPVLARTAAAPVARTSGTSFI
jgi:hypothetical protein